MQPKELKAPDPKLPGYKAEFGDLATEQIVQRHLDDLLRGEVAELRLVAGQFRVGGLQLFGLHRHEGIRQSSAGRAFTCLVGRTPPCSRAVSGRGPSAP